MRTGLFVLLLSMLFSGCSHNQNFVIFNYEIIGYKEIYTKTPILLDSTGVGVLLTINYDSTFQKCYGKLQLDKNLELYSNMEFVHEKPIIGFPFIIIKMNDSLPKRVLDPERDTIYMISKID